MSVILNHLQNSGILSLLLWLSLPSAINFIIGPFRNKSKKHHKRPLKPKKWIDTLSQWLLILSCIGSFYIATKGEPLNYLKIWQSNKQEPSFILRNKFRQFMVEKFPDWTEGITTAHLMTSSSESDDNLHHNSDKNKDIKHQMFWFENLYDKLRDKDKRKIYVNAGHDAFINCQWCSEPTDYVFHALPGILVQYVIMAIVYGISTMSDRKYFCRKYAAFMLPVLFLFEVGIMALADELAQDGSTSDLDIFSYPFTFCFKMRWIVFGLLSLFALMKNKNLELNDTDILEDIVLRQQGLIARSTAYKLALHSVLLDDQLRKTTNDHYEEKRLERNMVLADDEFKELSHKTVSLAERKDMLSSANHLTVAILKDCMRQGFIDQLDESKTVLQAEDIEVLS